MVLNPMASVDQHMMDDSDVAGPILFYLLFGAFLLLVIIPPTSSSGQARWKLTSDARTVWESSLRLHLRCRPTR